jgi:hypothetical protein
MIGCNHCASRLPHNSESLMDQTNSNAKTASSASSYRAHSVASWRQTLDVQSPSSDYAMEPSMASRHASHHTLHASPPEQLAGRSAASLSSQEASRTPGADRMGRESGGSHGRRASNEQRTSSQQTPCSVGTPTAGHVEESRGAVSRMNTPKMDEGMKMDDGSAGADAARLICVDAHELTFLPSRDEGAAHAHCVDHLLLVRNVSAAVVALSYSCLEDDDTLGKVGDQSCLPSLLSLVAGSDETWRNA